MSEKTIKVHKGGHEYVFCYVPGRENDVFEQVTRLADDADSPLDWLDAAGVGFRLASEVAATCVTDPPARLPLPRRGHRPRGAA